MNIKNSNFPLREKLILVKRVSKTVKGGRVFSFTALTVVGDQNGKIGFGYKKAKEVPLAISKSIEKAKKNLFNINLYKNTIPHKVIGNHLCSKVIIIPSYNETGIISGKSMKYIFEVVGIKNISSKLYGSSNPINVVIATINALKNIKNLKLIYKKKK
ncbi:30S ribosomal protein S5 [endosymbiont of Sipalinus gigas]|uniref:30S ribosomal protein S5 n=1 Tax=endosymbiont of Sipalinus gigas TaxID=1972134 RepID=UPI000DC72F2B|nr:30S ribosomal protein S5 [endosymbiont of Sipalinus gigas]BBA85248.1 30S ribosomal protein S5 [endosymbiont of Sipalinus gigas]